MDPLGGMGGLLGGFQQQMQALQAEAEKEEVEATAGGRVTVRMNGAQEVVSIRIDPKAMDDRELLEDLLTAATNDASRRAKEVVARKLGQLAASMGLPPGLF
jgi:DNA-binding YbaB/EbfC family protein